MLMLNIPGIGSRGGTKERANQFASKKNRMPVLALKRRNYCPGAVINASQELVVQVRNSCEFWSWAVNQGENRGIATTIHDVLHAYLKRAELTAVRLWIHDEERAKRIDGGAKFFRIASSDDNHKIGKGRQRQDGGTKKRSLPPWKQSLGTTHTRGLARRKDQTTQTGRSNHAKTVTEWLDMRYPGLVARRLAGPQLRSMPRV